METGIHVAVVFLAALATGGLLVNWIGLARALTHLSKSTYVETHKATNHTFDPYMPIVVVGALAGGIMLCVNARGIRTLPGELYLAGVLCFVAVLAVGLPTCVRWNSKIGTWSVEHPPDNWTVMRSQWVKFHILRTLFSIPALACYITASILPH